MQDQYPQLDMTARQQDYAVFLPALSPSFSSIISEQRFRPAVNPARFPAQIQDLEQLNWLNSQRALFPYRWTLCSGGHVNLDVSQFDESEDMIRNRESGSFVVGDSGGFQIGKGIWQGDWRDPNSLEVQKTLHDLKTAGPVSVKKGKKIVQVDAYQQQLDKLRAANDKRIQILTWLDTVADYSMTLDIPNWIIRDPNAVKATCVTTLKEAVDGTKYNNEYFIANRKGKDNGGTKFLNVLHGINHASAEIWYDTMKHYCDPKKYPGRHFDGWAMGGQNKCDVHLLLKRLVMLRYDGLLEQGLHDWMHLLGISRLEWAILLTAIQRSVRKHWNPDFTLSFDCASPFLAAATGQIYHHIDLRDAGKWTYRMTRHIDDHKYAKDSRSVRDVAITDYLEHFGHFEDSPVTARLKISDMCVGTRSNNSWDGFTYPLLQAHNVWMHIESVQRANREYDNGRYPAMLRNTRGDHEFVHEVIERVFSAGSKAKSLSIIDEYGSFWMNILGVSGNIGKKTINSSTMYNQHFEQDVNAWTNDIESETDKIEIKSTFTDLFSES